MEILGIDIGGSGIKGAPVRIETGEVLGERYRVKTPSSSTPENVVAACMEIARHFDYSGPIGCGFPGVIKNGQVLTAANLDKSWIGKSLSQLLSDASGHPCVILNDADAAGLGEVRFGAARDVSGTVLVVTLGTGIGTALFSNGVLMPNTEFGHSYSKNGLIWEELAADSAKKREGLPWDAWGKRVNRFLKEMVKLLNPDLILIGGGASKKFDKFSDCINIGDIPVRPTELLNAAGMIGAAIAAHEVAQKAGSLA